jgi:hypothetical protein
VNGTVRLLTLIAVALAGLIVIELTVSSGGESETPAAPAAQEAQTDAASQDGAAPADFATAILARPLFRPDRHPFPVNDQDAASTAPIDLPRLTGILMSDDLRRAIFAPDGADKAIVVAEGENVGDWRVQEIAADSVTMVGPDGTRRLRPKFAANLVPTTPGTPGTPDATDPAPPPQPPAPAGASPLPQIPKRGTAALNAHRQRHNEIIRQPPQPPQRKH